MAGRRRWDRTAPSTFPRGNDRSPRWAADGKTIFFLSTRSGSSQVWRISADGGEAEQVTDLPLDADNLIISPDGRHLGFTMEVFPGTSFEDTKKQLDQIVAGTGAPFPICNARFPGLEKAKYPVTS